MSQKRRNLVYISLDTLRADVAYDGTMKSFTELCSLGTVFRSTVASAPLTPVSHASILTGVQPFRHGVRHLFKEQLDGSIPTIAELAAAEGYRTGAVVSCPGMNSWYGLGAGFEHYDDEIPPLPDGTDALQTVDVEQRGRAMKRAPDVVDRGLEWLARHRDETFFLFLHFFDTHWPYESPERYGPEGINPYEEEAHYADHHVGRFIEALREMGLLDDTLVVVFSDHGEDLAGWYENDHAGEERGHPEEKGHGCLLFDATLMVPMVFVGAGLVPEGRVVDTQVRLIDLHPTVVELLGLKDHHERCGKSLSGFFRGEEEHRPAYAETFYPEELAENEPRFAELGPLTGVRLDNRYKVITDLGTGSVEVYDLREDPSEMSPQGSQPRG